MGCRYDVAISINSGCDVYEIMVSALFLSFFVCSLYLNLSFVAAGEFLLVLIGTCVCKCGCYVPEVVPSSDILLLNSLCFWYSL